MSPSVNVYASLSLAFILASLPCQVIGWRGILSSLRRNSTLVHPIVKAHLLVLFPNLVVLAALIVNNLAVLFRGQTLEQCSALSFVLMSAWLASVLGSVGLTWIVHRFVSPDWQQIKARASQILLAMFAFNWFVGFLVSACLVSFHQMGSYRNLVCLVSLDQVDNIAVFTFLLCAFSIQVVFGLHRRTFRFAADHCIEGPSKDMLHILIGSARNASLSTIVCWLPLATMFVAHLAHHTSGGNGRELSVWWDVVACIWLNASPLITAYQIVRLQHNQ